jgi:hypothetical protein
VTEQALKLVGTTSLARGLIGELLGDNSDRRVARTRDSSRETPFPENGLCPSLAGRIDKTLPIIQWINAATGFAAARLTP